MPLKNAHVIYAGGGESITRRTEALSCLGKSQAHAAPIIAEQKGKEMYRIDYSNAAEIYKTAVKIMSESRERYGVNTAFSVILDKESRRSEGEREWIEGDCPDWITFCGEMRYRGNGKTIEEIEWLESKISAVLLERNLMAAFNDGDKDGIDLCLKAMNGILNKARLSLGKNDSDRKDNELMWKVRKENDELAKYDTKKLEAMLDAVKGEEDE